MTTVEDDIYRRGIPNRFRYKSLNEMLSIISQETLKSKGYEVFFDSEPFDYKPFIISNGGVIQLSHKFNGQLRIPIDVYYYLGINSNRKNYHANFIIHYSDEECEEDARLLAEAIYNNLGLQFSLHKRNSNGLNGNGHH